MNKILQCSAKLFSNALKVNYGIRLQIMSKSKRTCNEIEIGCDKKKLKYTEPSKSSDLLANEQFLVKKIPTMHGIEVMDTPDKPETDKKSYRVIKLPNQLKVLLVSDPSPIENEAQNSVNKSLLANDSIESVAVDSDASSSEDEDDCGSSDEVSIAGDANENEENNQKKEKLAACGLSVNVGSFSDPKDVQGLAHFLGTFIVRLTTVT